MHLTRDQFAAWLGRYIEAWRSNDPAQIGGKRRVARQDQSLALGMIDQNLFCQADKGPGRAQSACFYAVNEFADQFIQRRELAQRDKGIHGMAPPSVRLDRPR